MLTEASWLTTLPLSENILEALPKTLEVLSININSPLSTNVFYQPHAFKKGHLELLKKFSSLQVLEISGIISSCQPDIWEVVWRSRNLRKLTLRVAQKPLIRNPTMGPMEDRTTRSRSELKWFPYR